MTLSHVLSADDALRLSPGQGPPETTRQSHYGPLAHEYYDPEHETTRNFEDATEAFLRTSLPDLARRLIGCLIDVGAGRGLTGRYLNTGRLTALVEVDLSREMLELDRGGWNTGLIIADALQLPFKDAYADVLTAFLFDPFNEPKFEHEVRRVLKSAGVFIGTLPSHTWATPLRSTILDIPLDTTVFHLKDGTEIHLPSRTSELSDLVARFSLAGFEHVDISEIPLPVYCTPSDHIRLVARILGMSEHELPVVTVIVAS